MTTLRVAYCTYAAANYAVQKWHYSHKMPAFRSLKLGVWEDGRFVGAVVFSDSANPSLFFPYGLRNTEGAELARVALGEHAVPVTQILSRSLVLLRARCPELRLVLSFADPEHGHHGGIYQAGNWLYLGMSTSTPEFVVNGVRMHGRAVRTTRSHSATRAVGTTALDWARKTLDPDAFLVAGSAKHRYALPLDRRMRKQLVSSARPYPAAEVSRRDTSAFRAEGAGAIPASRSDPRVVGD